MANFTKKGFSLIPIDHEGEAALAHFADGALVTCTLSKGRSLPHHRFFFAVLNHAFDNWPELTDFQPKTVDHLRAWLTVYAGWYDITEFRLQSAEDAIMVSKILRTVFSLDQKEGHFRWVKIMGEKALMATPKTIKFTKMNQDEFTRYSEDVFMIIEDMTGIQIASLREVFEENDRKTSKTTRSKKKTEAGS